MEKCQQTISVYEIHGLPDIDLILSFMSLVLYPTNRLNCKRYAFNIKVPDTFIRGRNIKEYIRQLHSLNPEIGMDFTCVIDPEFPEKNYRIFYFWVTRKFKLPKRYIPPIDV